MGDKITLSDIFAAQNRIKGIASRTPLKHSLELSQKTGRNVKLKIETMQATGSFKLRGAANAILNIPKNKINKGIITMSAGNHGKGVAYVAGRIGIKATICLSSQVPSHKIDAIKSLGAEVIINGSDQDEATINTHILAKERNMTFISAFDDPYVITGQGTIALEILEKAPETDTLIVQLSGGGLMSGIAIAAKSINPNIKLIGVSISHGAAMYESIKSNKIVEVIETESIADALQGGLPQDNKYTFEICRKYIDEIIQVSEENIAIAMSHALYEERLVLEGSGAICIAPLLNDLPDYFGTNIVSILSGDNVNVDELLRIVK